MRALRHVLGVVLSSRGLMVGVLAAAGVAGTAFLGIGGSSRTVRACFSDASGLVNGNEIRVAGIEAGSVDSVEVGSDPQTGKPCALVTLAVDSAHWPLRQGTTFAVRPKGVLSNVYVEMTPGHGPSALDTSAIVPSSQTSSPIGLDELNNVFDPSVRQSIKTQIAQGNIALGGTGAQSGATNLNDTLHNLNPLTADLAPVTDVLAQRSPELDRLNGEFDTIVTELSSEDANLRGLIDHGNTVLGALAAKQTDLQGLLVHAGNALSDIDNGLRGEEGNLQAIFQKGPTSLAKTKQAADLITPLIASVNPHIPHLDMMLDEFVSGNGYIANGVDTLRVDAMLPVGSNDATSCGGYPKGQPHCPYNGNNKSSGSAAPSGNGTTLSSDSGTAPDAWAWEFGGLFG